MIILKSKWLYKLRQDLKSDFGNYLKKYVSKMQYLLQISFKVFLMLIVYF